MRRHARVKIRARRQPAAARLHVDAKTIVRIEFHRPVEAITPGQPAVFYDGERVLGGDWLD